MATAKRVALITGGAKGIGRAIARYLASSGWRLGIIDLPGDGGSVSSIFPEVGCDAPTATLSASRAMSATRPSLPAQSKPCDGDLGVLTVRCRMPAS
jgi:NAD(P)-dependent dehydrogenase (short-subunit alcohol dehydrogenase family)